MNLYHEIFFSKWHLITIVAIAVAWISLWLGGYGRKAMLKSGIGATIFLYIIALIPLAVTIHDKEYVAKRMTSQLDHHYALRVEQSLGKELSDIDQLAAFASSRRDDDSYTTYIFAGNYSESFSFSGSLDILIYDKQGKELHKEKYEQIVLKPGEKKKIDQFYSLRDASNYQYRFVYHRY